MIKQQTATAKKKVDDLTFCQRVSYLSVCQPLSLSVVQSVCLSACLSSCLLVFLSVSPFCQPAFLSV